ncbi:MAG TPA: prepilin-type N-terminal cleavage/methylation domain-containing protein [Candidatus Eisenbacteria bacterium]|jgi:prepilin-type N-terminal cleavage/methylation domain-containing protein
MRGSTGPGGEHPGRARGFTLIELIVTLTVLSLVMVGLMTVMYMSTRSKVSTVNRLESAQAGRAMLEMMARDLRSSGYGADLDWAALPQPPIAYIDSAQVLINLNLEPYPDTSSVHKPPLAYQPSGNPKPFPLSGTSWQPPIKYRSGAEIVRWTLDVNNDGQVNASDVAAANGIDARRTPNPNDYELVRQVYGDSTGNVAGNNGGTTERIGLVRKPGGSVPSIFKVYFTGSSTPWSWANGPVPANKLADIERIAVNVVAPSGLPDPKGNYTETSLQTEVSSRRNVPNTGATEFAIDGYVYDDKNKNRQMDAGEPGLTGATVYLSSGVSGTTAGSGYYVLKAQAGTYSLKSTAPLGYGGFNSPDSFVVTLPPGTSKSFADTARTGGWVKATVYRDLNADGVYQAGETLVPDVQVSLTPGPDTKTTDINGLVKLFSPVGGYSVTTTPPDSYYVRTSNPMTGTMADGDSASIRFGLDLSGGGDATLKGTVFRDTNGDGVLGGGETGIQNVWVGVYRSGEATAFAYAFTGADGSYSINVAANDPPHTTAYSISASVPTGFCPTTTTSIGSIWAQASQTITGKNFGMSSFQIITLNASRVLCLQSTDLIENDWGTNASLARKDADLILGAETGTSNNISVWFDQYNTTPLFNADPTYTRNAPGSVLCMAMDTLDSNAPKGRPDLVTGTKIASGLNIYVWYTQNTSGNEGYFPTSSSKSYKTNDLGDVQTIATYDCAGNSTPDGPDLIVGTKSPTAGHGTIEEWKNDNNTTPKFANEDVYPTAGSVPSNLGEVTAMALADIDGDGKKDIVVGTRTADYAGQLMFLKFSNKVSKPHYVYASSYTLSADAVTALTVMDVDLDGHPDVVVGTQSGTGSGHLIYYRCTTASTLAFTAQKTVDAPGIVQSLASGDFGGTSHTDFAMGWRHDTSSYTGGLLIYYCDAGDLPGSGSDPTGGAVTNMVPALTTNNFNYGVQPSQPAPPYLTDLAAGVKSGATTGSLVVVIR